MFATRAGAAPVLTVTPSTGLAGGQTVALAVSGLSAGESVGWCQSAAIPVGVTPTPDWCGAGTEASQNADSGGHLGEGLQLQRFIYVPALAKWIDCTVSPCGAGAIFLGVPSGSVDVPIQFAPPPPPPTTRGTISLSPATGLHPDDSTTVTGSGFRSGALVDLYQCAPGSDPPTDPSSCSLFPEEVTASAAGGFSIGFPILQVVVEAAGAHYDCEAALSGPCRVVAAEAVDFPGTAVAAPVALAAPPVVIQPGMGRIAEGNSGTTTLDVPVTLTASSTQTITVEWNTLVASGVRPTQADPTTDYTPASGTITFAPGQTTADAAIPVHGDTLVEPDEYIVVSFHDPTNATVGGYYGLGIGTIVNDDQAIVEPGGGAVTAPTTGTADLAVSVQLTNPSTLPITAHWTTLHVPGAPVSAYGPQAPASDYTPASGTITFAPGATSAQVHIPVNAGTFTPAEYIVVSFTAPTNASMGGFWGLGLGYILPAP